MTSDLLRLSGIDLEDCDRPFLITDERMWTYKDALQWSTECLSRFRDAGLSAGSVVAFVAHPTAETVLTFAALWEAGIVAAPLHPRWTEAERAAALARWGDTVRPLESLEIRKTDAVPSTHTDDALWLSTSGSTATPKTVILTRSALIASAAAHTAQLGWTDDDRWLLAMPLGHVGGISVISRCLQARRTLVLATRFDPSRIWDIIRMQRITLLSVVPTMLRAMMETLDGRCPLSLRAVLVGGAACPPAWLAEARERGIPVLATYGMTETAAQIATQSAGSVSTTDVGVPLPGVEIQLFDSDVDGVGRIAVRGPMRMRGYLGQPPLDPRDWWPTGDLGRWNIDGRLEIVGRADDVLITGGENVHPAEVETVLRSLSGIRDALVVGVADPVWGQTVGALLVGDPSQDEAIRSQLVDQLASFRRPRVLRWVEAIPLGSTGKPDRRAAALLLTGSTSSPPAR